MKRGEHEGESKPDWLERDIFSRKLNWEKLEPVGCGNLTQENAEKKEIWNKGLSVKGSAP